MAPFMPSACRSIEDPAGDGIRSVPKIPIKQLFSGMGARWELTAKADKLQFFCTLPRSK